MDLTTSAATALLGSCLTIAILVTYLVRRPHMHLGTRLWLVLGLGVLPLGTALAGNAAGLHASKQRRFCGSCHVMQAHTADVSHAQSQSLAARHSRNARFGQESCYVCHADYGMFGGVMTKVNGLVHVAHYLLEFRDVPLGQALPRLHLFQPYQNANCMQCHTARGKVWNGVPDHAAARAHLVNGGVSCASEGCHGYAHPFSKTAGSQRRPKPLETPLHKSGSSP